MVSSRRHIQFARDRKFIYFSERSVRWNIKVNTNTIDISYMKGHLFVYTAFSLIEVRSSARSQHNKLSSGNNGRVAGRVDNTGINRELRLLKINCYLLHPGIALFITLHATHFLILKNLIPIKSESRESERKKKQNILCLRTMCAPVRRTRNKRQSTA